MTVKELMEKFKDHDPDAKVMILEQGTTIPWTKFELVKEVEGIVYLVVKYW